VSIEKISEILQHVVDPIAHVINNKIASMTAAAGLIAAGKAMESAEPSRNLNDIPITEIFNFVPSIAAASMYLGGAWMIICISKELFKFATWLRGKYRDRKNKA
jgi:hypothetical protein